MKERDRRALAHLKKDDRMKRLVELVGKPRFHEYSRFDLLHNLLEAIVAQQLSAKVAQVIFGRFKKSQGPGFPDAEKILSTPETELRSLGLSRAKALSVRDLCERVADGSLDLNGLREMPDGKVIERLIKVKGIGPWTAHMALIFALSRPDVWPVNDLGLRKGLAAVFDLEEVPDADRAMKMGEKWRPYRSYACWYLWQFNDLPGSH